MNDRPLLGAHIAVFNNHLNDADRRVRAMMREVEPKLLERVEEIERDQDGIMGIFNLPPEQSTSFYVGAVWALVNADRRIPR